MKVLSFSLEGEYAVFTSPLTNEYHETYSHLHRPALLGLLGALVGWTGHREVVMSGGREYPDFFERGKGFQIAIIPAQPQFEKRSISRVHGTGHGNADSGCGETLCWTEEVLIRPKWQIYLGKGHAQAVDFERVCDFLVRGYGKREPYLGRNHCPAIISEVRWENLCRVKDTLIKSQALFSMEQVERIEEVGEEASYHIQEWLPYSYYAWIHHYQFHPFVWTNQKIRVRSDSETWQGESGVFQWIS